MADWTLRELRDLLRQLRDRGVQLWHNRGRLMCAPMKEVKDHELRFLQEHRSLVLETLRRKGFESPPTEKIVAPFPMGEGSYHGWMPRKPWDYELAVMIPVLDSADLVKAAVRCWRNQTVSPYLILIDTGSNADTGCDLDNLRSYDLEIHTIAAHGWRHSSAPVSAALDLAFAVCQTERLLLTHCDVFPKHDKVLEELVGLSDASKPVVGYQMSRRFGSDEWLQCVSHACTMLHMPTVRRSRLTWNLLTALESDDELNDRFLGWPDTETQFGRALKEEGIAPHFLGREPNLSVYEDERIVHWRSAPSVRHYLPKQRDLRHLGLEPWLALTTALGRAAPLPEFKPANLLPEPSAN